MATIRQEHNAGNEVSFSEHSELPPSAGFVCETLMPRMETKKTTLVFRILSPLRHCSREGVAVQIAENFLSHVSSRGIFGRRLNILISFDKFHAGYVFVSLYIF